ncbi:hypothetical protein SAY86_018388 [Trapa natans]|uniref:BZIP domain-containing protein n=1 Tax=Trapa natans TaxID=22666 RepID=A0AAN7LEY5_TRANT|nr:hypothetical protein SAY86_018388 [Trapa natans]
MDEDKCQALGGGGFHVSFSHSWDALNLKSEPLSSSSSSSHLPPMPPPHGQSGLSSFSGPDMSHFSPDLSRMTDNPPRNMGHRRAHSEILTLPDDLSFDSDLGVVGGAADGPSLSDETEEDLLSMYLDMDKLNSSVVSSFQAGDSSSTPVSAGPVAMEHVSSMGAGNASSEALAEGPIERPRIRHQHSQSMDGSTSIKTEMLMSGSEEPSPAETKKAAAAAKLAELALIDPKRAKRIWANRQSAARSKERKMRYIGELERKVKTLQTEATSLSAQLTLLQRDTSGLNAENSELKLRLQSIEQQVHLQDALNDALKEEIQHLKLMTGQAMPNGGPVVNFPPYGSGQHFYPNNQAMHTFLTAQQFQQLQIHSQKQQQQQQQQHFQQQQQQQQQHHQLHQLQQVQQQHLRGPMPSSGQNDGSGADSPSVMKD